MTGICNLYDSDKRTKRQTFVIGTLVGLLMTFWLTVGQFHSCLAPGVAKSLHLASTDKIGVERLTRIFVETCDKINKNEVRLNLADTMFYVKNMINENQLTVEGLLALSHNSPIIQLLLK